MLILHDGSPLNSVLLCIIPTASYRGHSRPVSHSLLCFSLVTNIVFKIYNHYQNILTILLLLCWIFWTELFFRDFPPPQKLSSSQLMKVVFLEWFSKLMSSWWLFFHLNETEKITRGEKRKLLSHSGLSSHWFAIKDVFLFFCSYIQKCESFFDQMSSYFELPWF